MPDTKDEELSEKDIGTNLDKFRRMFNNGRVGKPIDSIVNEKGGSISQMAADSGTAVHTGGWNAAFVEDACQWLAGGGADIRLLESWLFDPSYEVHHIAHVQWAGEGKIAGAQFDRFVPSSRAVREEALPAVRADDVEIRLRSIKRKTADPRFHRHTSVDLELIHKGERTVDRELVGQDVFGHAPEGVKVLALSRASGQTLLPAGYAKTMETFTIDGVSDALMKLTEFSEQRLMKQLVEMEGEPTFERIERSKAAHSLILERILDAEVTSALHLQFMEKFEELIKSDANLLGFFDK